MHNEKQIHDIEKKSFLELAKRIGSDPNQLAKGIMLRREKDENKYRKTIKIEKLKYKDYTIDTLIEYEGNLFRRDAASLANKISSFVHKYSDKFDINLKNLEMKANQKGIESDNNNDWLPIFLNSTPIILLHDYNIQAEVQYFNDEPQQIIVSKFLDILLDTYIPPLIMNFLHPIISSILPLNSQGMDDTQNLEKYVDAFIKLGESVLSPFEKDKIPSNLCKYKEIASEHFGASMYWGMYDFIFLHEFSHIIFDHNPKNYKKQDEIQADMLALNVMLHTEDRETLWTKELSSLLACVALGPTIFLKFIGVLYAINGMKETTTHPYPLIRSRYLIDISRLILNSNPFAWQNFMILYNVINVLFDYIYSKLNLSNELIKKSHETHQYGTLVEDSVEINSSHPYHFVKFLNINKLDTSFLEGIHLIGLSRFVREYHQGKVC